MHAIRRPFPRRAAIDGIEEADARLVAELGAGGPVEPRVCRRWKLLLKVGRLPILDEQDGMAPNRAHRRERRIEVDVELIPAEDRDIDVVAGAAAFLHRDD